MDVSKMQRKLAQWSVDDKEHKFFDIYHLLHDQDWLYEAYRKVKSNSGSKTAGCDGINMTEFEKNLEHNLQKISEELKQETFVPQPTRRITIPQSNGKRRPLGIPAIGDRIVQESLRKVLEPIYEGDFIQYSFGFRPNRSTMDAIKCVLWSAQENKRYFWIIEGDISSYFDNINQKKLMKIIKRRIKDKKIFQLIWKFLKAGVMEKKLFRDTNKGNPQGGILSPLLANIYLHELDKYMEVNYSGLSTKEKKTRRRQGKANFVYIRYADDFIVMSNGKKEQVEFLKRELTGFLKDELKLKLSEEKTKITHLNDGFRFLGFWIHRCIGQKGKMTTKVEIPREAIKNVVNKIKAATDGRTVKDSTSGKILALNRIYGGWCRYYQYASHASTVFNRVYQFLFWKMAHWIGRKYRLTMPNVMKNYYSKEKAIHYGKYKLLKPLNSKKYIGKFIKPNLYLEESSDLVREELPSDTYWTGYEERTGMLDLKAKIWESSNHKCSECGCSVNRDNAHVDHIKRFGKYKTAEGANRPENLSILCLRCHEIKSSREFVGWMESRMQ
ncbi:MAG: group II intron reverse transcriptase/maturase [Moorea sp. SIO2B7]|nr:group II intron reverse transcriptase/maturase [Moorena sp. SIO2B7]